MTSEQARWFLVFQGDLFFGVSLFLLFYVQFANRIAKIYVTQGDLTDTLGRLKAQLADKSSEVNDRIDAQKIKMDSIVQNTDEVFAKAKRSERAARKIHDSTYKMLKKIREAKSGGG